MLMSMADPIWTPSPERVATAQVQNLIERVGAADFQALHRWSVNRPDEFWRAVWDFVGIRACRQPDRTVDGIDRMPGARWFPGARLNFADNLLRYDDDREALVHWSESGTRRTLTYRALRSEVCTLASALERDGVRAGDRVAGLVANVPEAVVAMLAATSLGAIWSSCSPDFGADAVVDRFGQIRPKVLFAVDGYRYGGKPFSCASRLAQIVRRIDSIERMIVVPSLVDGSSQAVIPGATWYADYRRPSSGARFAALPFDHPAYVLYSSGTTGIPKCIVHGAGGTLIQHLKELVLHVDLRREDRVFYFTSCGWMMWNWLVSGLAVGATVVLYDGSPFHAGPTALLDMAEREGITVFGTSAKYLSAIEKVGLEPIRTHCLDALRTILSTGSPLAPESFDYVYRRVKRDVALASISGGTDIVSCFALADPTGPVYRGELQTAGLGMRVEVYGDDGRALPIGRKGRTRLHAGVPLDARRILERSGREQVPSRVFREVSGRLASRGLLRAHGACRIQDLGTLRYGPQSRRGEDWHGRDLQRRRIDARGSRSGRRRLGDGGRRGDRAVRPPVRGNSAGQPPRPADQGDACEKGFPRGTSPSASSKWTISRARGAARSPSRPCAARFTDGRSRTCTPWKIRVRWKPIRGFAERTGRQRSPPTRPSQLP